MNEVTPDRAVGVPSGIQWVADSSDEKHQGNTISVRILDGIHLSYSRGPKAPMLIGRDAFSGLILWETAISDRQSTPFHQFGLIAAEGRAYVHLTGDPHAKSFDLHTGALRTTYDQGVTFTETESEYRKEKGHELRRDPSTRDC